MSRIRADNITNRMANGAPTAPNGLVVSGVTTVTTLDLNGDLDVDGHLNADNVSIAGVATATTVSATTVSATTGTFGDFIDVGNNIKLGNAGVITATSFVGSGAALTGIDATAIKDSGGNVKIQAQASGAIHTGVSTFNQINLEDDKYLKLGTGNDLQFYHLASDNNSYIKETGSGSLMIQGDVVNIGSPTSGEYYIRAFENADVQIRYNNSTKIQTTNTGAVVTGICTATTFEATTFSKTPTNTPAFHAWSNNVTSHSIADSTFTKVTFLNSETFDTDNAYDNSTSGTTANRFTVPSGKGGYYQVNAGLNFFANLNDIRGIIARIQQNGATKITQYGFISSYAAGTRHFQVNLGGILNLAAGDYIELFGWLDTNGNSQGYFSNDANGYRGNYFSAFKLII